MDKMEHIVVGTTFFFALNPSSVRRMGLSCKLNMLSSSPVLVYDNHLLCG
jgi:hypothetical protein